MGVARIDQYASLVSSHHARIDSALNERVLRSESEALWHPESVLGLSSEVQQMVDNIWLIIDVIMKDQTDKEFYFRILENSLSHSERYLFAIAFSIRTLEEPELRSQVGHDFEGEYLKRHRRGMRWGQWRFPMLQFIPNSKLKKGIGPISGKKNFSLGTISSRLNQLFEVKGGMIQGLEKRFSLIATSKHGSRFLYQSEIYAPTGLLDWLKKHLDRHDQPELKAKVIISLQYDKIHFEHHFALTVGLTESSDPTDFEYLIDFLFSPEPWVPPSLL